MKKKLTVVAIAVLAALAVAVAVLAVFNAKNSAAQQALLKDAAFVIQYGETERKVTAAEVLALGPQEIDAIYKKSGKDPETRKFSGVPFAQVLKLAEIDPSNAASVTFSASDGYASILPIADALNEESCFIVVDEGSDGPLRMIVAKDQFSQRWCKLLTEVKLK